MKKCSLIYNPVSSGFNNDIAPNFNLPKNDPIKSAQLILDGQPCEIDIICSNGKPFGYVSCFGFLTNVPYETSYNLKMLR